MQLVRHQTFSPKLDQREVNAHSHNSEALKPVSPTTVTFGERNRKDRWETTVLQSLVDRDSKPDIQKLQALLSQGIDVNAKDTLGDTALSRLMHQREISIPALKLLLEHNADVNSVNDAGMPPTYYLLKRSNINIEALRLLLDAGVEMNNGYGIQKRTFLHWVMEKKEPDIDALKVLLEKGADPYTSDFWAILPLHHYQYNYENYSSPASEFLRAYMDNPDKVKQELFSQKPKHEKTGKKAAEHLSSQTNEIRKVNRDEPSQSSVQDRPPANQKKSLTERLKSAWKSFQARLLKIWDSVKKWFSGQN